jgi:hypothetical protein
MGLRLTSKAGDRPPYGQKDANFGLDPLEGWVRPFYTVRCTRI